MYINATFPSVIMLSLNEMLMTEGYSNAVISITLTVAHCRITSNTLIISDYVNNPSVRIQPPSHLSAILGQTMDKKINTYIAKLVFILVISVSIL